jgi:recombination protein RecA
MPATRVPSSPARGSAAPSADARDPSSSTTSPAADSAEDSATTERSSPSAANATARPITSGSASSEPDPDLVRAVRKLEKTFGPGIAFVVGQRLWADVEVIPTGLPGLDIATGVGGIPYGRLTEIFGPDSSGKTTLALHIAMQCQLRGRNVLYVDTEHSIDMRYATLLGVDLNRFVLTQPEYAEQAFAVMIELIETGQIGLVVLDSVAMLLTKAEYEGEVGDSFVGVQPRLVAQGLRKLIPLAQRHGVALMFLNQIRERVGVSWGANETTPGGRALRHMASLRLDVRRGEKITTESGLIVGNRVKVTLVKNKLATPLTQANLDLYYGEGFCPAMSLLEVALECGVLERKASGWVVWRGETIAHGREAFRAALRKQPQLAREILEQVLMKYGISGGAQ